MSKFQKGDWVKCLRSAATVTSGKTYKCDSNTLTSATMEDCIYVIDNTGDRCMYFADRFEIYGDEDSDTIKQDDPPTLSEFDKIRLETAVGIMAATQSDDTFAALLSADTLITHIIAHPWKQMYQ